MRTGRARYVRIRGLLLQRAQLLLGDLQDPRCLPSLGQPVGEDLSVGGKDGTCSALADTACLVASAAAGASDRSAGAALTADSGSTLWRQRP